MNPASGENENSLKEKKKVQDLSPQADCTRGTSGSAEKRARRKYQQGSLHKVSPRNEEVKKPSPNERGHQHGRGRSVGNIKGRVLFKNKQKCETESEEGNWEGCMKAKENFICEKKASPKMTRNKSWPDVDAIAGKPTFIVPKVQFRECHGDNLIYPSDVPKSRFMEFFQRDRESVLKPVYVAKTSRPYCKFSAFDDAADDLMEKERLYRDFDIEDLEWYTQPLESLVPPSPIPQQRLYRRDTSLGKNLLDGTSSDTQEVTCDPGSSENAAAEPWVLLERIPSIGSSASMQPMLFTTSLLKESLERIGGSGKILAEKAQDENDNLLEEQHSTENTSYGSTGMDDSTSSDSGVKKHEIISKNLFSDEACYTKIMVEDSEEASACGMPLGDAVGMNAIMQTTEEKTTDIALDAVNPAEIKEDSGPGSRRLSVFMNILEGPSDVDRKPPDEDIHCSCPKSDSLGAPITIAQTNSDPPSAYKGHPMPEVTQNKVPDDRPGVNAVLSEDESSGYPLVDLDSCSDFSSAEPCASDATNHRHSSSPSSSVHICASQLAHVCPYLFESSVWNDHLLSVEQLLCACACDSKQSPGIEGSTITTYTLCTKEAEHDNLMPTSTLMSHRPASVGYTSVRQSPVLCSPVGNAELWSLTEQLWNYLIYPTVTLESFAGTTRIIDEQIWKDHFESPVPVLFDINIQRRMDSPQWEHPNQDSFSRYFMNLAQPSIDFIQGGLYGGDLALLDGSRDAWYGQNAVSFTADNTVDNLQDEGMWIDFSSKPGLVKQKSSSLENLNTSQVVGQEFYNEQTPTKISMHSTIQASETSAFTCDIPPHEPGILHNSHSEPALSPRSPFHTPMIGFRTVEVKHLYKPDTTILRQLGLASGSDEEEVSRDSIEYSPECHFKPIRTPQNSPASDYDPLECCQGGECNCGGTVMEEDVITVLGSSCDTVKTLEEVCCALSPSYRGGYQLYQVSQSAFTRTSPSRFNCVGWCSHVLREICQKAAYSENEMLQDYLPVLGSYIACEYNIKNILNYVMCTTLL